MPRLLLLLALLVGCTTAAPIQPIEPAPPDAPPRPMASTSIAGRWTMTGVYDRGTNVTAEHNPAGDRYIALFADGTFESGGQPYGRNTGRWFYDSARYTLDLDSDLGPEDDSRWIVILRGDTMEWDGDGSDFARRFRITSRRIEP